MDHSLIGHLIARILPRAHPSGCDLDSAPRPGTDGRRSPRTRNPERSRTALAGPRSRCSGGTGRRYANDSLWSLRVVASCTISDIRKVSGRPAGHNAPCESAARLGRDEAAVQVRAHFVAALSALVPPEPDVLSHAVGCREWQSRFSIDAAFRATHCTSEITTSVATLADDNGCGCAPL